MEKRITHDLIVNFNDIVMRELGLDITDDDKVYDMDTNTILQFNEKFIIYSEVEFPALRADQIELNLLENSRLMHTLFGVYLNKYAMRKGIEVTSYYQSSTTSNKSGSGYMAFTAIVNGVNTETKSDNFLNESVRAFNLICKLNGTSHLYDFNMFDIIDER